VLQTSSSISPSLPASTNLVVFITQLLRFLKAKELFKANTSVDTTESRELPLSRAIPKRFFNNSNQGFTLTSDIFRKIDVILTNIYKRLNALDLHLVRESAYVATLIKHIHILPLIIKCNL
jgi:hypothetical protein